MFLWFHFFFVRDKKAVHTVDEAIRKMLLGHVVTGSVMHLLTESQNISARQSLLLLNQSIRGIKYILAHSYSHWFLCYAVCCLSSYYSQD